MSIDPEYVKQVRKDLEALNRRYYAVDADDLAVDFQNLGALVLQMTEQMQKLTVSLQCARVQIELLGGTLEVIDIED